MEPGVPFALLGAIVLLAVAAWTGLAATAVVRSGLGRAGRGASLLVLAGGLVLAVAETLPVLDFGQERSDVLPAVRTAGLLLLGGGLWSGALSRRRSSPAVPVVPGIVVPLAAAPAPALLAAAAGLAAAGAALRSRRDGPGVLLALGLLLVAASSAAAPLADGPGGALLVLLLRGAAALLVLAALAVLARSSVLGKVVSAILAGVLLMATAAVGVVGTVVARNAEKEQQALVTDAALGRIDLLDQNLVNVQNDARFAAGSCSQRLATCGQAFDALTGTGLQTFAALVPRTGTPTILGGRAPLDEAEVLALAGGPVVTSTLAGGANAVRAAGLPAKVRLLGTPQSLALVVVVPRGRPTPTDPATAAFVFGIRLDDDYVGRDLETSGFGFSLLIGDRVVASNRTANERVVLERIAKTAGVGGSVPEGGRTVAAEGSAPTVHFRPLEQSGDPVGTLALSREADRALASQETALQALLLTALVSTALVGGLALLLGRRTVDPLRRLTAAASRVAAGDLTVTTGLGGRDEVGVLSRTFDAMTGSVARLTGDLRASASRLETVLSSMSDGLIATDGEGRVTSINRAALAMAGISDAAGALGYQLADVVDVRIDGQPLDLADSRRPDVEAEVHPLDGDPVPVRVAVAPLDVGEGLVLVLRDTTREREVERMKTEFLSNVSHELRTPLTPIRGYADILVAKPGLPPEKVTAFAGTILAESLKMNRVVDLLVDVAAIEAGRVTITPRPVAPGELVDGRLNAWRERAPERAGDLRRRVAARLPAVQVDPVWLGKAIDELVDNAVKHTPAGTAITLAASLAPGGDRVRLAVRDAGPGIARADRDSLFLSFEQVDGSATRRVGGLGLGLSFVRRLAQDAGFPLSVSSELGKGAEFALDLPLADGVPPAPRRPSPRRVRVPKG
jgi:two-component system phosphate regulon sensor histidine kinase PhoR